jgi:hypothetical protein
MPAQNTPAAQANGFRLEIPLASRVYSVSRHNAAGQATAVIPSGMRWPKHRSRRA